jgi:hypothetical protein
VLALAATAIWATPAHAHAADADRASDYRTELVSVPEAEGLSIRLVDAGSQIELHYDGPGEVVVLGYAGEPYLRIGEDGVFENLNSPATYLNRSLTAETTAPAGIDAHDEPEWRKVSARPVVRWHDHRAHWMGAVDPPAVRDDPRATRVVMDDATIPLLIDGQEAEIVVDVWYEPGPPAWLGWTVVAVAFVVVVAVGLRAPGPGLAIAAVGAVVSAAGSVAAALLAAPVAPPPWWLVAEASAVAAIVAGLRWPRTGAVAERSSVAYGLIGAGGLAIAALALVDRAWLARSHLPVDLAPWLARLLVAGGLAFGAALAVLALRGAVTGRRVSPPASNPTPPNPTPPLPTA